jgi:hypothetical protein
VKDQSQNPSLAPSSSKWLNSKSIDNLHDLKYDDPISIKGGAMIPEALEYSNNTAHISIEGGSHRKKKLVKSAARWMLGYVLGTRLANNIDLNIRFEEELKNTPIYATVTWEDNNHKPRVFDMELCNYITDRTLMRVLSHEVVHIRQYATGDLKDLAIQADYCKWKNKLVKVDGQGRVRYWDLPWEIEARHQEKEIFREWRNAHGYHFKQKSGEIYK